MLEELYEAHADDATFEGVIDSPMIARDLLIEYQRNERKERQLRDTLVAVRHQYEQRISALEARQAEVKRMLADFVEANGKQSFPDVGGCHLVARKPALKVTDVAAAEDAAHDVGDGDGLFKRVFDQSAYKAWAESRMAETGELAPGVEMVTPEPSLTIRGAK